MLLRVKLLQGQKGIIFSFLLSALELEDLHVSANDDSIKMRMERFLLTTARGRSCSGVPLVAAGGAAVTTEVEPLTVAIAAFASASSRNWKRMFMANSVGKIWLKEVSVNEGERGSRASARFLSVCAPFVAID